MAKVLQNVTLYMTSANGEFDEDKLSVRYTVADGDLSKVGRWIVSGLDLNESTSGFWDLAIAEIETIEGI